MSRLTILSMAAIFLMPGIFAAYAIEYPIGSPKLSSGVEIASVYLQPVEMEPEHIMRPAFDSDIHFEGDIHATAGNVNGFAEGDWIPNLKIEYTLARLRQPG